MILPIPSTLLKRSASPPSCLNIQEFNKRGALFSPAQQPNDFLPSLFPHLRTLASITYPPLLGKSKHGRLRGLLSAQRMEAKSSITSLQILRALVTSLITCTGAWWPHPICPAEGANKHLLQQKCHRWGGGGRGKKGRYEHTSPVASPS